MAWQMFKDDNGQTSNTRVSVFLIVCAYLIWATFIVFSKKVIPDIPLQVGGLVTMLYGINKFGTKKKEQ